MTSQTKHQALIEAVREFYPNARVKKADRKGDNFLDIYLPHVHDREGVHLYFNTARNVIRIGLHCRYETFVAQALARSHALERYCNGVRPVGNPEYNDVASAIKAARAFLALLPAK